MELRPYQQNALQSVKTKFAQGNNKQIVVLPTGAGKTIVFAQLIKDLKAQTGKKALVIAHRSELLKQAKDKILRTDPTLRVDTEKADDWADHKNADVIVASIQTIGRAGSDRIKRFDPKEFGLVITDEAHHSNNETYKNGYRHLGVMKNEPEFDWNKECLHLGVTATPSREDNKGIGEIFNEITYQYAILDAIQDGWLTRIKAFRVNTATSLAGIKNTAGDFNLGELGDRVNNTPRNELIVKTYLEKTPMTQALCFAVDVEHTVALTNEFRKNGVPADYVIGATSDQERERIFTEFKDQKIKVMVNCMVLTEGFDEESIQTILMARPTQSGILFQQMIGRGTRLHKDKEFLTIIDFVDNSHKHTLKTSSSLIGMEGTLDFNGMDILEMKPKLDKLLQLAPRVDLDKIDINNIDYTLEEVDLLSGLKIPDEVSIYTKFDWHRYGPDAYRINLDATTSLLLTHTMTGQYQLSIHQYSQTSHKEASKILGQWDTLEQSIRSADYYINKKFPGSVRLVSQSASWRNDRPSDAQYNLLKKFGVPQITLQAVTKGDASRLITKLINMKRGYA